MFNAEYAMSTFDSLGINNVKSSVSDPYSEYGSES